MITQCPGCQTRFRLPLDQVASSRGEVFCGECHSQFNALDYLVIEEGVTQKKPTLTDRAQSEDENMRANTMFLPIDENAIANLLSESPTTTAESPQKPTSEENHEVEDKSPQLTPIAQSTKTEFIDTLIQDALKNEVVTAHKGETEKHTVDNPESSEAVDVPPTTPVKPPQQTEKYELNHEVDAQKEAGGFSLWKTLISATTIVLLITTLGLQYLVEQREHFSQHRYFRPLLTTICPYVDCTMPPKRQLSLLSIVDNRIETHPQYPDALLITAELSNQGSFEQNYPVVELIMTNIQQEVIARRHFNPGEYLPAYSEIPGGYFAASSSELLQLEVVDPGSHATGFEFILHNRTF